MKKAKKIIAILLMIMIVAYIAYAVCLLIINPTDTYIIKIENLSKEDSTTGYIIRDEKVIKGENYENGIYAIAAEGQKVAKAESIFRYYSSNEKEISKKMDELDYQIQTLLEQEKNTSSADIKAIENQTEEKIERLKELNNYQEIAEYKNNIDSLISKKINFIGDATENNEIKKLINQRNSYEEQLKKGSEYITANDSGIVSYRVDGLEEEFSIDKFDQMTESYLEGKELKTGQIIATSNECGKIIDNFQCYIVSTMDSESAMNAKIGDTVEIRTSSKIEENAKIIQINEESGKRTIIFKLNKMDEELINHRKISLDVIWWSQSGLKVPNQALIEEDGKYYILRNKSRSQSKILVNVKMKTEKFSIISSYSATELKELGYDDEYIKSYKKISNYDEIVLNPSNDN